MRKSIQELYEKISGREVFILGGGPSVNDIDLPKLKGKHVVCINNSFKDIPNPVAIYWCDESWVANNYDAVDKHTCKLRFTARHSADAYIAKDIKTSAGATVLKRTGDRGFDDNVNNVRGNNSGAHVLNFLTNLRPRRIVLLGFDMKIINSKSHYHGGYGLPMSNYIYDELFIPSLETMAPYIEKCNVEVINCSKDSALSCFKKVDFKDIIK